MWDKVIQIWHNFAVFNSFTWEKLLRFAIWILLEERLYWIFGTKLPWGWGGPWPPPTPTFEKKFPSIYISIKNLLLALKLIYTWPPSPKQFTSWPMKPKMKKIIKSSLVWLSQEYQEKHLAKYLDNLQIRTTRKIYKTIHIFRW